MRVLGRVRLDRGGRGALHADIERRPDLDRLVGLGQDDVELRQHPVGEVAHRVLPRLFLELYGIDIDAGLIGADVTLLAHQAEHHLGPVNGSLHVGCGRILARGLDEAGDDRCLTDAEVGSGVAEEFARGGVDPVSAAAEIDLVEIELENLLFRELPLERECKHRLARLAIRGPIAVEEQVARQLLGDRRGAPDPRARTGDPFDHRARQAHGIDAEVRAEPLVLHRDHGIRHVLGGVAVIDPVAETWPDLDKLASVARPDHNGLAGLGGFQRFIAGQRLGGKADRDGKNHKNKSGKTAAPLDRPAQPRPAGGGRLPFRAARACA